MVNFAHKASGCLKLPGVDSSSTVVQRGQEGNESFKMVVVATKNSTGVGRNRPWKMGGREWKTHGKLRAFFFFFFPFFLSYF
ncbi:S2-RNase [Pyrus ussuriensis x Pyrus communis]|uniref:S2-RNase n=1 Tax=Pyrus ussuriensis x Pyrus communis TaxID=2448454 RepID=A0A5N5FCY0_9ROSA|nr:S2-RNase [Pyrus ussuriensis x Pyrus communis]